VACAPRDPTRGLRTYPRSAVQRPLNQRTATLKVRDGDATLVAPRFAARRARLGRAARAVSGHGKAMVTAYLADGLVFAARRDLVDG